MADPVDEILSATPKPTTRQRQWGRKGVPKSPANAHARIRASRAVRRKPNPTAVLSGTYRKQLIEAVEAISNRFGVSRAAVMEKFITNGIRDYGTPLEIEQAGLKAATPFDKLPDVKPVYQTTLDEPSYVENLTFAPIMPPKSRPSSLIGMTAGSPTGYAPAERFTPDAMIEDDRQTSLFDEQ